MNRYALLLLLAISMNTTGCDRDEAPDDASMDSTVPPVDAGDVGPSIARIWNDAALDAIRRDLPAPGVHARNLFHVSVAMYDAWAAYETEADGYVVHEKVGALDVAARRAAISHAAYRVLRTRYAVSVSSAVILAELDLTFSALGYDALDVRTTGTDGVALGNRIAETVLAHFSNDGATNMMGTYGDPTYMPVNAPLVVSMPGATLADVTRWQPLYLDAMVSQNGIPVPETTQGFVGARWGGVRPFALEREDPLAPYHDPGAPPRLGGVGDARMRAEVTEVLRLQSLLDPTSPETINLSPNSLGNNALGRNDGRGYGINPITGMPYADRVVPLADFGRVLAEYWADGPESETPPGHWNVIANEVADDARFERRFFGTGDLVDPLEWDVVVYFMLNGALHDAAICAWGIKRHYDSIRPISLIRYMATQGQASDSMLPSYDVDGLELVPGLVELITSATTAVGERHESLAGFEGEIARAWLARAAAGRREPGCRHRVDPREDVGALPTLDVRDARVRLVRVGAQHVQSRRGGGALRHHGERVLPGRPRDVRRHRARVSHPRGRPDDGRPARVGDVLRRRGSGRLVAPLRRHPLSRGRRLGTHRRRPRRS